MRFSLRLRRERRRRRSREGGGFPPTALELPAEGPLPPTSALLCRAQEPTSAQAGGQLKREYLDMLLSLRLRREYFRPLGRKGGWGVPTKGACAQHRPDLQDCVPVA
jgi:hypothetical protein